MILQPLVLPGLKGKIAAPSVWPLPSSRPWVQALRVAAGAASSSRDGSARCGATLLSAGEPGLGSGAAPAALSLRERTACLGCDEPSVSLPWKGTLVSERHRARHSYKRTDTDNPLPASAGREQNQISPCRTSHHPFTSSSVLLACLSYVYAHRRKTLQPSFPALRALLTPPRSLCLLLASSTSRIKSLIT